jgi:hypothetical protein
MVAADMPTVVADLQVVGPTAADIAAAMQLEPVDLPAALAVRHQRRAADLAAPVPAADSRAAVMQVAAADTAAAADTGKLERN